jgi:hypothetical protein
MSRTDQRRRRVLRAVAPVAGLLAVGLLVWQGSYAAFSATTQNNTDAWTSGSLSLTNNGGIAGAGAYVGTTTATFGGAALKPGSTGSQCLTVKSTGTAAGSLKLYENSLADSGPSLGAQIQVTIDAAPVGAAVDVLTNCAAFPAVGLVNVATNVPLTLLPTTYGTAVGPVAVALGTQNVAYRVNWTFVSAGTTALDNALQSKTVTAGFTWEIQ